MLGISVAAISDCQKKTSPRISSFGTPAEIVLSVVEEVNVKAEMNSFTQREKEKMTTVRIPGRATGKTILTSARRREHPSTSAASSSSCGMVLKKPIRSQVANGIVNDGYTTISDQSVFRRCSSATKRESGRNSRVGGTR